MAFKLTTLAQYGEGIPSLKEREKFVVRHNIVNGREQVEMMMMWEPDDGGEARTVWVTNNFGRKQPLAIVVDTEDALDTLIAALTAAKGDFTETPKAAAKAPAVKGTKAVTIKPVVRAKQVRGAAKGRTAARKAS